MKEDVLPEGWVKKLLITICNPKQYKTIPTKELLNEGYIVYGANGKIGFYNKYTHENPTLMITCRGATCGNLHISEPYSYINGNAMALDNLDNDILLTFLYYSLANRGFKNEITGSAQPQITRQSLSEVELVFPPLPEQQYLSQKLTALLDEVAQAKQRLEAIPALLKQFRQSVLADAVSGRLTEGNADKWNTQPLKSLTTKIGSGSTPKGGNDVYQASGIPFVRSLNIHTHFIKYEDLVFIDEVQAEKLKNVKIEENDVLLNITGASIGRVNIAPKEFVNGRVNQHVAIIRLKQEALLPTFLHLVLASPKFQKWIEGENYGTTRQALTKGMLETLEIHYPDIATQTQIVQKVETYFALADEIETQVNAALENVNLLTQSILAKAFNGELSAAWRAQQAVKN